MYNIYKMFTQFNKILSKPFKIKSLSLKSIIKKII